MSELVGQTLGQYQIAAVLGEGGMATVYRAHQLSIKRDVAIKVIESKLARNPEFVTRFEREAQTVAGLDHPHILKVFDFGQQGDLIYLVMELKTGGTLNKQLSSNPLPLETIAALLTQIASALDYAHGRGIIHRDLNPQNVLLDEQGNAFLTDFGIAKLIQPDYTSLTQTGAAMGTPAYMSPEQWQGHALDARSDLYALGIMLYEMLTGRVPFRADTPASMMFAHLQQNPPPLRELRPTLPHYLEPVISMALAKSPDARFQTAKALADAFRDTINGKPFVTPSKSLPPLSEKIPISPAPADQRGLSRPLLFAGALILILAIGGLILTSQRNNTSSPTNSPATQVVAEVSTSPQPSATGDITLWQTNEALQTQYAALVAQSSASPVSSATLVLTVTETASLTATASVTPTPTVIALTNTSTFTPTAPLDLASTEQFLTRRARARTAVAQLHQTATAHGSTPTFTPTQPPDLASTEQFLTRRARARTAVAQLHQTATARGSIKTPTAPYTPPPALTSDPLTKITRNENWSPTVTTFDGVAMVLVPVGCFSMGSNNGEKDERPVHDVCITHPFYLDRFEVTNEQFDRLKGKAAKQGSWTDATLPRESLTWDEANAYCQQRGGRLPTEAEWEYAARGPNGLEYPWGNEFIAASVAYSGNSPNQTAEVGINRRPNGKSWVGAYDMSGNVWEWVADYYGQYLFTAQNDPLNSIQSDDHGLRGGSWVNNDVITLRSAYRFSGGPKGRFNYRGVRCARAYTTP